MFCGAALTFPGSGDGLLVVAMFRMVIALVAGVGRDSCAQARIAQHLSARASTSAGLPATLSLNKKNVRENRPISGQKCISTMFIRWKTF